MKVSILMLTYNAPLYVYKSIKSLKQTNNVEYELIVVDNNSNNITKKLLWSLYRKKLINKLYFNNENALFAGGNNLAAKLSDKKSSYICLLNSDIEIKNPSWLENLVNICSDVNVGGVSYGAVEYEPIRADGYCLLMKKDLYTKYQLDEDFQWWWSVTKLEAKILNEGKKIVAFKNHEDMIHHFGGKSGNGYKDAKGMDVSIDEVKKWFKRGKVQIIENVQDIIENNNLQQNCKKM